VIEMIDHVKAIAISSCIQCPGYDSKTLKCKKTGEKVGGAVCPTIPGTCPLPEYEYEG